MAEPISLAQAKLHCRVDSDVDDALIGGYITAAREWVEEYTSHVLMARQFSETADAFGAHIVLARRPVTSIDELRYLDSVGDEQPFTDFRANLSRAPVRLSPVSSWPVVGTDGYVTVTYTAGFAAGEEPAPLVQAMYLLIGHWYDNREAGGTVTQEIAMGVSALCDRYRPLL